MKVIYGIQNKVNNKIYVGSTKDFIKRIKDHKKKLKAKKGINLRLQYAWDKYGEENFEFKILDILDNDEDLFEKELSWIDKLNSKDKNVGYNIVTPYDKPPISDEAKERMRKARYAYMEKNGIVPKPKKIPSPKYWDKVVAINLLTNEVTKYDSNRKAAKALNISRKRIEDVLRGTIKRDGVIKNKYTANNYHFIRESKYTPGTHTITIKNRDGGIRYEYKF